MLPPGLLDLLTVPQPTQRLKAEQMLTSRKQQRERRVKTRVIFQLKKRLSPQVEKPNPVPRTEKLWSLLLGQVILRVERAGDQAQGSLLEDSPFRRFKTTQTHTQGQPRVSRMPTPRGERRQRTAISQLRKHELKFPDVRGPEKATPNVS